MFDALSIFDDCAGMLRELRQAKGKGCWQSFQLRLYGRHLSPTCDWVGEWCANSTSVLVDKNERRIGNHRCDLACRTKSQYGMCCKESKLATPNLGYPVAIATSLRELRKCKYWMIGIHSEWEDWSKMLWALLLGDTDETGCVAH